MMEAMYVQTNVDSLDKRFHDILFSTHQNILVQSVLQVIEKFVELYQRMVGEIDQKIWIGDC